MNALLFTPHCPARCFQAKGMEMLLCTANVPGGVFPKGMLRDAKQNPELASAKMQFIAFCTLKGRTVHREACYWARSEQ